MRILFSFFTVSHTVSTIRRICLFLHSVRTIENFQDATRLISASFVTFQRTTTHRPIFSSSSSSTGQKVSTIYSFWCSYLGCMRKFASLPSFVSKISPVVSLSSLQIGNTLVSIFIISIIDCHHLWAHVVSIHLGLLIL
jgi:hypothetical protein